MSACSDYRRESSSTDYCSDCMGAYCKKQGVDRGVAEGRFKKVEQGSGDWLVLLPDSSSSQHLADVAKATSAKMAELTGRSGSEVMTPYSPERMHLSIGSPLKGCLSSEEAEKLLTVLSVDLKDRGGVPSFKSSMEKGYWGNSDDVFKFGFTGLNYQPYVTMTSTQIGQPGSDLSKIRDLANQRADEQKLFAPGTSPKQRRPHFSLGKVQDAHREAVHKVFHDCSRSRTDWGQHDALVDSIGGGEHSFGFKELALMRVIREPGQEAKYYKVGSYNLLTEMVEVNEDAPRPKKSDDVAGLVDGIAGMHLSAAGRAERIRQLTSNPTHTPDAALELVELFEHDYLQKEQGRVYYKFGYYHIYHKDEVCPSIMLKDFDLGDDLEICTGTDLNERYADRRGHFDFAKAIGS